jgi:hypothetical protein
VVIETGLIAGYVIVWMVRKAKRAGARLDAEVDTAMDTGLDKLHGVVAAKLGTDPALTEAQEEASTGQVSELARHRVELSVQAAAEKDPAFAQAVAELVEQLQAAEKADGQVAAGHGSANVAGNVDIHAEDRSAAAWNMGDVSFGQPPADPHRPDRSRD